MPVNIVFFFKFDVFSYKKIKYNRKTEKNVTETVILVIKRNLRMLVKIILYLFLHRSQLMCINEAATIRVVMFVRLSYIKSFFEKTAIRHTWQT